MKPIRIAMAHDLIVNYGLFKVNTTSRQKDPESKILILENARLSAT
jgi:hypothetical protein